MSHLYVYDGDLQNQDVIAWRVGQGNAQVVSQLRQLGPLAADPRPRRPGQARRRPRRLPARRHKAVALSRTETVHHARGDTGPQRLAHRLRRRGHAGARAVRDRPLGAGPGLRGREPRRPRRDGGQGQQRPADDLIVIAVALALSAFMAFVITRSITRPLAVLVQRLRSVTDICLTRLGTRPGGHRARRPHRRRRAGDREDRLARTRRDRRRQRGWSTSSSTAHAPRSPPTRRRAPTSAR